MTPEQRADRFCAATGRRAIPRGIRSAVLERDDWTCAVCRRPIRPATGDRRPRADELPSIDHVIPLSRGGTNAFDNLQATHWRCNRAKARRLQMYLGLEL